MKNKRGNASSENKDTRNNCTRTNNFQFICNHPLTQIKHAKLN